ncbi:MAG TPA: heme ABC transporter ATP-binding protein [Salinisphaeraceae bacterium]|nr:heme ABC transporter ATP-binding protein [Salinisphaeraceae bacterium]
MSCLSADKLTLARANRRVLQDVSLRVTPGEVVALVGPNGAGKSTLLRCLSGELTADAGCCSLDGTALRAFKAHDLARRRAVLPQDADTRFPLMVADVMAMARAPWRRQATPQHNQRAVRAAAAAAGVVELMARDFRRLSGGERQRVQLARVLAQIWDTHWDGQSRYLLLDEPTSSLDVGHQQRLLRVVREVLPMGIGVLAVLHDLNLAAAFADRMYLLAAGRLVTQGAPTAVIQAGPINSAYGAELDVRTDAHSGRPLVLPAGRAPYQSPLSGSS